MRKTLALILCLGLSLPVLANDQESNTESCVDVGAAVGCDLEKTEMSNDADKSSESTSYEVTADVTITNT